MSVVYAAYDSSATFDQANLEYDGAVIAPTGPVRRHIVYTKKLTPNVVPGSPR